MIGLLIVVGEVVRGAGARVRSGENAETSRRRACASQPHPNRAQAGANWRCEQRRPSTQSLNQ